MQKLHFLSSWQIDGYPIGDPTSVVLSNIFCVKMKFDENKQLNLNFTNIMWMILIVNKIKNQRDKLSEKLNIYHLNIKLKIEINLSKRYPHHSDIGKNLEPAKCLCPNLHNPLELTSLTLFLNGVT